MAKNKKSKAASKKYKLNGKFSVPPIDSAIDQDQVGPVENDYDDVLMAIMGKQNSDSINLELRNIVQSIVDDAILSNDRENMESWNEICDLTIDENDDESEDDDFRDIFFESNDDFHSSISKLQNWKPTGECCNVRGEGNSIATAYRKRKKTMQLKVDATLYSQSIMNMFKTCRPCQSTEAASVDNSEYEEFGVDEDLDAEEYLSDDTLSNLTNAKIL